MELCILGRGVRSAAAPAHGALCCGTKQPFDAQVPSARAERHGAAHLGSRCAVVVAAPAHRALSCGTKQPCDAQE
eukprot:5270062-Pyramimonas_sp.AAC.1